jgi:hypothetical protein
MVSREAVTADMQCFVCSSHNARLLWGHVISILSMPGSTVHHFCRPLCDHLVVTEWVPDLKI